VGAVEDDGAASPAVEHRRGIALVAMDAEAIRAALRRKSWNKVDAARALGISRTQLYEFMRRYGIPSHDYD